MATREAFLKDEIRKVNPLFSSLRAVVESTFYENNVTPVNTIREAYKMAKESKHTIVTDLNVKYSEKLGLPKAAKVLVENGGGVVGRTAAARRILDYDEKEDEKLSPIIREAVFQGSKTKRYKVETYVGLDQAFMVKAHLSLPQGQENNVYSWLLNFQIPNDEYNKMYRESKLFNEGDIYIYSDPEWEHPDYPLGLVYFDPKHNTAVILGMNYFGELKKATLTLAWNIARRNNYVPAHGGMKKFNLSNDNVFVSAFFGLSGSGKSTLTHAKHGDKFNVEVLHDDAFIVSVENGSSIALEPSYFDKTQDYPSDHREIDYFLTVQNVGVTQDSKGNRVLLTEDLRNGNGRTVKSRYSTPNRVDRFDEKINAIFWIMKDNSLPPVLKISDSTTASMFGATLATKRTSAENLKEGIDSNSLVIEPYANPFRVYPLIQDYNRFKQLFEEQGIDCYILNTGDFLENDIPKEITLKSIEKIVENNAEFNSFMGLKHMDYMTIEDYEPNFGDSHYVQLVKERMKMRKEYIEEQKEKKEFNALPDEAIVAIQNIIQNI